MTDPRRAPREASPATAPEQRQDESQLLGASQPTVLPLGSPGTWMGGVGEMMAVHVFPPPLGKLEK